jgi:ABC-2 type transport system permease protein
MFKNFKKILQQKNILKTLVIRNLKARYEGSFLGMLWTVITPLIITAVISFVFTRVLKVGIPGFALFVLSAFLPWMFFSRTLNESANSIIVNSSLLNQFHFPKELIPLSVVISNIISFLAGFIVILPIFFVFNPAIGKYIWILPFNILFFSFFVLGMCFFLSAVTVYVRDINHLLG